MTEEAGTKVTANITRMRLRHRYRIAVELIDALVLLPLFSPARESIFHCDPYAGNLLYDKRRGRLVLIDWALTESLSFDQRRHLIVLFANIVLRNRRVICHEIAGLAERYPHPRNIELI
jgi:ubiquinone biosynthesis protein